MDGNPVPLFIKTPLKISLSLARILSREPPRDPVYRIYRIVGSQIFPAVINGGLINDAAAKKYDFSRSFSRLPAMEISSFGESDRASNTREFDSLLLTKDTKELSFHDRRDVRFRDLIKDPTQIRRFGACPHFLFSFVFFRGNSIFCPAGSIVFPRQCVYSRMDRAGR